MALACRKRAAVCALAAVPNPVRSEADCARWLLNSVRMWLGKPSGWNGRGQNRCAHCPGCVRVDAVREIGYVDTQRVMSVIIAPAERRSQRKGGLFFKDGCDAIRDDLEKIASGWVMLVGSGLERRDKVRRLLLVGCHLHMPRRAKKLLGARFWTVAWNKLWLFEGSNAWTNID